MFQTESFLIPNYHPVGFPALLGARVLVLLDAENPSRVAVLAGSRLMFVDIGSAHA